MLAMHMYTHVKGDHPTTSTSMGTGESVLHFRSSGEKIYIYMYIYIIYIYIYIVIPCLPKAYLYIYIELYRAEGPWDAHMYIVQNLHPGIVRLELRRHAPGCVASPEKEAWGWHACCRCALVPCPVDCFFELVPLLYAWVGWLWAGVSIWCVFSKIELFCECRGCPSRGVLWNGRAAPSAAAHALPPDGAPTWYIRLGMDMWSFVCSRVHLYTYMHTACWCANAQEDAERILRGIRPYLEANLELIQEGEASWLIISNTGGHCLVDDWVIMCSYIRWAGTEGRHIVDLADDQEGSSKVQI